MAKNNSKARKAWRKERIDQIKQHLELDPEERLLMAIFGERPKWIKPKPGTEEA